MQGNDARADIDALREMVVLHARWPEHELPVRQKTIVALLAALEAAERERDKAREKADRNEGDFLKMLGASAVEYKRAVAAEARLANMETALRRFGLHEASCALNPYAQSFTDEDEASKCDCGFYAALVRLGETAPAATEGEARAAQGILNGLVNALRAEHNWQSHHGPRETHGLLGRAADALAARVSDGSGETRET